jgi:hypothetical protein
MTGACSGVFIPFIRLLDAGIGKIPIYIKGVMDKLKRCGRL